MKFPIKIYRVAEQSMEPSIEEGAYIVVNRNYWRLARGDAVVLKDPESSAVLVKRISSISGSRIFVIGDNRALSRDSRNFGEVGRRDLVGKVMLVI